MRFRVLWLPTIFALCGIIATILLGNWQMGRAREKAALQAALDHAMQQAPITLGANPAIGASLHYRLVKVHGHFIAAQTIFLDNRLRAGVAGYEVITPFALENGWALAVNRGWVAAEADRSRLPNPPIDSAEVTLVGLVLPLNSRFIELSPRTTQGSLWQNFDLKRYAQTSGLKLLPMVLQLHSEFSDGLSRQWPRPDLRIDTHRAYAMQWYTFSAAILILYIVLGVRRG